MVNVVSRNQKFNISKSLYESILKNDPELLYEDKKDRSIILAAIKNAGFEYKTISKKDLDELEQKFINDRGNLINIIDDFLSKNNSIASSNVWSSQEKNRQENSKSVERYLKNKQEKLVKQQKKEEEKEQESLFSDEEKEEIKKAKEKGLENKVNADLEQLYKAIKSYIIDSDIPDVILVFYSDIKKEFINKNIPGVGNLLARFNLFGKREPLSYIANTPKNTYVDDLKNNHVKTSDGIEVWRIAKEIPSKEFWKNTAVISCVTKDSYSLVTSIISNLQSRMDEIECYGKPLPIGLKARTIIYKIRDKKSYVNNNLEDIRMRQNYSDMKKIGKNRKNDIESEKNNKLYPEKGETYRSDEETLSLFNKIRREYFIIVTEGIIQKGDFLKNIVDKTKQFLPKNDYNKNDLFTGNYS